MLTFHISQRLQYHDYGVRIMMECSMVYVIKLSGIFGCSLLVCDSTCCILAQGPVVRLSHFVTDWVRAPTVTAYVLVHAATAKTTVTPPPPPEPVVLLTDRDRGVSSGRAPGLAICLFAGWFPGLDWA